VHFVRHTLSEPQDRKGIDLPDNGTGNSDTGTSVVIGMGQSLRGDDGAGLAAVKLWQTTYQEKSVRPAVRVELSELPGIGLLNLLEGCRFAILVDAVRSGAGSGTIHQITEEKLKGFSAGSGSAHGWGVAETLVLGRETMADKLPGKIILIGIEAGQFNLGDSLSTEVQQSLSEAARLIEQYVIEALA
jgi:hydrogenase maturation protease